MKNKWFILILAGFLTGMAIYFISSRMGGNVSQVNRTISESELYTKVEIERAMDVVERAFKSHFKDCTLTDLWYDEDFNSVSSSDWATQYEASEAIVLLSNFNVGSSGGDGSLNPNETYEDWEWILVRNSENDKWTLEMWGY